MRRQEARRKIFLSPQRPNHIVPPRHGAKSQSQGTTGGRSKSPKGGISVIALLSGYQKSWLPKDIVAGVSVAAVAVPIAIAYAHLAGMPPVYGLYSSLLPLVAYALLGSSRQLILAPDGATCALVAAVVAPLAGNDLTRYLALTSALTIIGGIFCVAAGWGGLGFLANFLARPILTGYLNGIAIWIITSQLGT